MKDFRICSNYNSNEIELHNTIVNVIKKDKNASIQKILKKIGKQDDVDELKNVIQHLFCLTPSNVDSIIARLKKVWRKK